MSRNGATSFSIGTDRKVACRESMPHFQLTVSIGTHSATTPWCQVGPQVIPSASCAILSSGRYWLYHKTPAEQIRTVSRIASDDFVHWKHSRKVLAPDAYDPPDTQFYGLSAFPYAEQYLGLLWVYHTYAQTMDLQLASSRDGSQWGSDRRPQAAHPPHSNE